MANIKKINIGGTTYDIEALHFGGRSAGDWEDMIHGVVDTYVIKTEKSSDPDYASVVNSEDAKFKVTKSVLDNLVNNAPTGTGTDTYKVGDIILMEDTSDGKKVFDRWISSIEENGDIYLSILETQVATHHHEIPAASISKSKAIVSVRPTYTASTDAIAKVGDDKTVVTGVNGTPIVVTSVTGGGSVNSTLSLSSDSSGLGHSHTVDSHNHSVTLGDGVLVSTRANAYTSLTSVTTTLHNHNDDVTAAGSKTGAVSKTVVTGGNTTACITSLKDESNTTSSNTAGLTTGSNTAGTTTGTNTAALSTGVQVSSSASVDVDTADAGSHSHTVNVETTTNVVKSVDVAGSVITSITFGAGSLPTVQGTVVKSVTSVSKTVMTNATLNNATITYTSCSISGDVLYFESKDHTVGITPSTTVISTIGGLSTGGQSAGSLPSLSFTSVGQSFTSGKVSATGSAADAGSHSHGFAHTHTIESHTHSVSAHTHTIASHTHTYKKSVKDGTANAYTSLTSVTTTLHDHNDDVTAAGSKISAVSKTVVTGGNTTSVIAKLKADAAYDTDAKTPGTDTKYYKLTGTITHSGYTFTIASLKDLITTDSVTQAAAATTSVLKSITTDSSDFVTNVTKTGVNKGGNP
jgi:peptidase E